MLPWTPTAVWPNLPFTGMDSGGKNGISLKSKVKKEQNLIERKFNILDIVGKESSSNQFFGCCKYDFLVIYNVVSTGVINTKRVSDSTS